MDTTLLIIAIVIVVLFMFLEADHFLTVRRMNKHLERNNKRLANMRTDLDGLKTDLIELDRINNELEGYFNTQKE